MDGILRCENRTWCQPLPEVFKGYVDTSVKPGEVLIGRPHFILHLIGRQPFILYLIGRVGAVGLPVYGSAVAFEILVGLAWPLIYLFI